MLSLASHTSVPRWQDVSTIPTTPLQQSMLTCSVFWVVFSFIVYALRMYSRYSTKQIGTDDWLMTAAVIFELVDIVSQYLYFRYGYVGFPASEVSEYDPSPALLFEYLLEIFYNPILALVKSSILVFLLRIGGHQNSIRWTIHAINVVNLLQMVVLLLVVIFDTSPVQAAWNPDIKSVSSINFVQFAIASGAITIATDVLVLAMPIWIFIGLNMRTAQKIGLIVLFLAGGVVTTVSCVRLATMQRSFSDPTFDFNNSWGPAYAEIETNLAIVTACVPALRPLLVKWLPQYFKGRSTAEGLSYSTSERLGGKSGRSHHKDDGNCLALKEIGQTHTRIRGYSPDGSEEEIMTYNGILRTTNVQIVHDIRPRENQGGFQ